MKDLAQDSRNKAVLQAAWQAFATYGFRKTSMDDIAKGAGMSRPAVYTHYRNKEDIFRSLVQHYYDGACNDVEAALMTEGAPAEVLERAFFAQMGDTLEAMLSSPHGLELLDAGAATASDIKDEGEARLSALYADWIAREAAAGRIAVVGAPKEMAATISIALKGIKTGLGDYAEVKSRVRTLAALLGAGLTPR